MDSKETIIIAPDSNKPLIANRLGYGTMRLTGEGIWGEPKNRDEALEILKRCISAGVNFIDTADYYSRGIYEEIIGRWLVNQPKRNKIILATKLRYVRQKNSYKLGVCSNPPKICNV